MNQQYKADLKAFVFVGGLTTLGVGIIIWQALIERNVWREILVVTVAVAFWSFIFLWLLSFRIEITANEVIFRSLFGKTKRIRHTDIKKVRLAWQFGNRAQGPMRLIIEPCDKGNTLQMSINAKVFSRKCIDAVLDLGARVAEADDDGLRDGIVLKTWRNARSHKSK